MNYKMVKQDEITWVTLEPLLEQVMQHREEAIKIDTDTLSDDEKRGLDFTILSLEAVVNFLRSLLAENNLREEIDQAKQKESQNVH